jgi:hypothetical protein
MCDIIIFVLKINKLLLMEVNLYITSLVKTYRRLFNCLMFYN